MPIQSRELQKLYAMELTRDLGRLLFFVFLVALTTSLFFLPVIAGTL